MTDQPFQSVLRPPVDPVAGSTAGPVERITARQAARIVTLALLAGLLGQLLFVGQRSGINVPLWVALALAGAFTIRPPDARLDRLDAWLPAAALSFATFVALRDDGMLLMFNLMAAGGLTLASVVAIGGLPVSRRSASAVLGLGVTAMAVASFGAALLAHGLRPMLGGLALQGSPMTRAVVRGVLIAVPLLAVFVTLFSAADAVFGVQLRSLLELIALGPDLSARVLAALVLGWLFAGAMTCAWLSRADTTNEVLEDAGWRLGVVEAVVVLVLLDTVFALFVAVQAAYLFGGLDTLAVGGLTYADYARRGFFELVAVAVLVGMLLLVLGRVVERRDWPFRLSAIVLAALTAVILVSAAYRMALYQGAYGWTELRFYVLAAICWLGACLLATVIGLGADRRHWLPAVILGSGLVVAVAVNLIGPQAFVAERNLERAINPALVAPGGETGLDTDYMRWLGADSVPAMVAARDRLPPTVAADVDRILRSKAEAMRDEGRYGDWPSWNLARHRALEALAGAGY